MKKIYSMKWINASERKPENWLNIIVRNIETKEFIGDNQLISIEFLNEKYVKSGNPIIEVDWEKIEWLDELWQSTELDIYALGSSLNTERITKYRKLAEDFNLEEGTVRDIFCRGADWGIEIAKRQI